MALSPRSRDKNASSAISFAVLAIASALITCALCTAPAYASESQSGGYRLVATAAGIDSLTAAADTSADGTSAKTTTKTTKKATAKKKVKKGNCDAFIGLPKRMWVLATGKTEVKIHSKASANSSVVSTYRKHAAVVVDTSNMKKGKNYTWLKVKSQGRGSARGYVRVKDVRLQTIDTKTFGLDPTKKKNRTRIAVCRYGLPYMGTKFVHGGSSLQWGIDCSAFVRAAMRANGVNVGAYDYACVLATKGKATTMDKLKPGDMVFYHTWSSNHISHCAIYIGKGFIINASGHHGRIYPAGGIRISKVWYRTPAAETFRNIIG